MIIISKYRIISIKMVAIVRNLNRLFLKLNYTILNVRFAFTHGKR